MPRLSQEVSAGAARLRLDIRGSRPSGHVLDAMPFLNYRLAEIRMETVVSRPCADVVWYQDEASKQASYADDTLVLRGDFFQGEIQKVLVSMMALRMEDAGLHPLHASAVRYRGLTIMFLGGESNHGKSMAQIEGCRRGGQVVSTETTVVDERGWAVLGSKSVFLRQRSKGTERADKLDQDQGVAKFFDRVPEFVNYDQPSDVDLVIVPSIDGHFDTAVVPMIPFERNYQTYHSLMNYLGVHEVLAPGLPMPLLDNHERRAARADFCKRFAVRKYWLIRARTPQVLFDELEKVL